MSLPLLTSTVQQPLANLRSDITGAPLKEYSPTDITPRKIQYQYPTLLPRTESYKKLLRKNAAPLVLSWHSLSKSVIYTDVQATSGQLSPSLISPSKESNPNSLHEVNLNINAYLVRNYSDSSAPTLLISRKADPENIGMAPLLLKRQVTESKLLTKFSRPKIYSVMKLEGQENLGASFSLGRRLRSSPSDWKGIYYKYSHSILGYINAKYLGAVLIISCPSLCYA